MIYGFDFCDLWSHHGCMTKLVLSRGDLVQLSGAPNDALTFWLRQGLIVPIEAADGAKRHLRFERHEAKIAAMLASGRRVGLNVDALRVLSSALRTAFEWIEAHAVERSEWEAMVDEESRVADLAPGLASQDLHREPTERIKALVADLLQGPRNIRDIIFNLLIVEGVISLNREDDDSWSIGMMPDNEGSLPFATCVLFDIKKTIGSIVWTREVGR
ncbi:hypothetical protein [Sphingomonas adhaesiva]|uniref:hypothetical protein n=1 Tax=Sphingomonas adhaesiva TaxID=28212 RepID=UPI002FF4ABBF